jgi:hypothetical protein
MGAVARKRCIQKLCWQNPSREAGETKISNLCMPLSKHVTGQKKYWKNKGSLGINMVSTQNIAHKTEVPVRFRPSGRTRCRQFLGADALESPSLWNGSEGDQPGPDP